MITWCSASIASTAAGPGPCAPAAAYIVDSSARACGDEFVAAPGDQVVADPVRVDWPVPGRAPRGLGLSGERARHLGVVLLDRPAARASASLEARSGRTSSLSPWVRARVVNP